ncbi:unnamed protein product [Ostreobium quekettii]|uniref:Uncharacterized protein n=1 Tax=Ostreobium quekettii TaxID=121088 RepID=A0A8S1IU70_9CHLO|nr:unnamed protein product [Ostreobium quekettii]|eukprot:evm.model.scf_1543.5 EVM.evm.TU.scf_1543.5   scf_1543:31343-33934(-)
MAGMEAGEPWLPPFSPSTVKAKAVAPFPKGPKRAIGDRASAFSPMALLSRLLSATLELLGFQRVDPTLDVYECSTPTSSSQAISAWSPASESTPSSSTSIQEIQSTSSVCTTSPETESTSSGFATNQETESTSCRESVALEFDNPEFEKEEEQSKEDTSEDSFGKEAQIEHEDYAEPLLQEEGNRFCMFPLRYPRVWDIYKAALSNFWTVEDIDLQADSSDWHLLSGDERSFVKDIVGVLGGSDAAILQSIALKFMTDVMAAEARAFYGFQLAIENVHNELYGKLLGQYFPDETDSRKRRLTSLQKKADWAARWMGPGSTFPQRIVALGCIQSVNFARNFFGAWLKGRGAMPALTHASGLICRDRDLQAQFNCMLYGMLDTRLTERAARLIVQEAVSLEKEFVREAFSLGAIGIGEESSSSYVEFLADELLEGLGHRRIYLSRNPFEGEEHAGSATVEYQFSGTKGSNLSSPGYSRGDYVLTTDEDF